MGFNCNRSQNGNTTYCAGYALGAILYERDNNFKQLVDEENSINGISVKFEALYKTILNDQNTYFNNQLKTQTFSATFTNILSCMILPSSLYYYINKNVPYTKLSYSIDPYGISNFPTHCGLKKDEIKELLDHESSGIIMDQYANFETEINLHLKNIYWLVLVDALHWIVINESNLYDPNDGQNEIINSITKTNSLISIQTNMGKYHCVGAYIKIEF